MAPSPVTPRTPSPALSPLWVDAAPFRAHLLHLAAATGLSPLLLAVSADVPVRQAEALLRGRRGRRVRRLRPQEAAGILALTASSAALLRTQQVDATPTGHRLGGLLAAGCTLAGLATALGVPSGHVEDLALGQRGYVTREFAHRVLILCASADRARLQGQSRAA